MTFKKKFSLTAADELYFLKYAPALVMSAIETGNPLMLAVINARDSKGFFNPKVQKLYNKINNGGYKAGLDIICITPFLNIPYPENWTELRKMVYYASARFHLADWLLGMHESCQFHVMDIDSLFMKPLDLPDVPLGLYLREEENLGSTAEERRGMKVLGHVILSTECSPYIKRVSNYIIERNWSHWFLDQEALFNSLTDVERAIIWDMKGKDLIDWEFTSRGKIWSGKGKRKHTDETYLKKFNRLTEKFNDFIQIG